MYDEEKAIPLLPLTSSSPPLSTNFTDIPNYGIEDKTSTTPTSPVPAISTSPSTSTWTTPANGERSQEVQNRMDIAAENAMHACRQRNHTIIIHMIWAITVIISLPYAAPLLGTIIIILFKQVMAAFGLSVVIVRNPESHHTSG